MERIDTGKPTHELPENVVYLSSERRRGEDLTVHEAVEAARSLGNATVIITFVGGRLRTADVNSHHKRLAG